MRDDLRISRPQSSEQGTDEHLGQDLLVTRDLTKRKSDKAGQLIRFAIHSVPGSVVKSRSRVVIEPLKARGAQRKRNK